MYYLRLSYSDIDTIAYNIYNKNYINDTDTLVNFVYFINNRNFFKNYFNDALIINKNNTINDFIKNYHKECDINLDMLAYDIFILPEDLYNFNRPYDTFDSFKKNRKHYNKYYIQANKIIRFIKLKNILK